MIGVALSGVFMPGGWVPDAIGAITAIANAKYTRVGLPFWRSGWSAPAPSFGSVIEAAHAHNLDVDLVPHHDGPSFAQYGYEPLDAPANMLAWLQDVLQGLPLRPADSLTWWNEISPRDPGDWAQLHALYQGLGAEVHALARKLGVRSVAPVPMGQTPADARDFLNGCMDPQIARAQDLWCVHLYKDDLSTLDVHGRDLDGQFGWIDALSAITEIPAMIGEFGGTLPAQAASVSSAEQPKPDPAFYRAVATMAAARTMNAIAWQYADPGDGLVATGLPIAGPPTVTPG